jgi:hypothetical protein
MEISNFSTWKTNGAQKTDMKKLFLIAISLVALAGLAGATPINCGGPLMNPNSGPVDGPVCTATAPGGFFISALTLTSTDDYTGYISGNPTVSYTIGFDQNPGFAAINGTGIGCQVTTTGSPAHSVPCSNTPQTINGNFGGSATVQLNASNTVANGVVTGASVVYTLDYAVTQIQTSGTPEPATLGMMGSALVGLGFLARRKKK